MAGVAQAHLAGLPFVLDLDGEPDLVGNAFLQGARVGVLGDLGARRLRALPVSTSS